MITRWTPDTWRTVISAGKTHSWMMRTCSGNMFAVSLFFETLFKIFNPMTKLFHNMKHSNIKDEARWFIKSFLPKFHNVRKMLLTCKGWNVKIININNKNNPKKMKLKKNCTKHLLLQYLNSVRLGPSFLYEEGFSLKKKICEQVYFFFLTYTFLYKFCWLNCLLKIQVYEMVPVFLGLIHLSNIAQC